MKTFTKKGAIAAIRASIPQILVIAAVFTAGTFLQHLSETRIPIMEETVTVREPTWHDVSVESHAGGSILVIRSRKGLSDYILMPTILILGVLAWRVLDPREEFEPTENKK